jgi:hypothetical protein
VGEEPEAVPAEPVAQERASEWTALLKTNGEVYIEHKGKEIAKLTPGLFDGSWSGRSVGAASLREGEKDTARATIAAPDGTVVDSVLQWSPIEDGVRLSYTLTPRAEVKLNSLHVSMDLPISHVVGRDIAVDDQRVVAPEQFADTVHLTSKLASAIDVDLNFGRTIHLRFAPETQVLVQDNRRWGPTLSLRIGTSKDPVWPAGQSRECRGA